VDGLREALYFERQQVLELEAELTRQCEMNCTLLKEISWLAKETENNRSRGPGAVLEKGFDKKKIERLTSEVVELKQVLKTVEDEKTNLSNQFEKIADSDRREIDRLALELNVAKSKLAKAEEAKSSSGARFVPSIPNDRKEVDRLRLQIRQMEIKLTESQQECHQLRQHASSGTSEAEELRGRAKLLEAHKVEMSKLQGELDRLKSQASRVDELEGELAKLQEITTGHVSRGDEVDGLKSLVQSLESSLSDADATKAALLKEQEKTAELNSTIAKLRSDLKAAEARVQALSDEVAQKKITEDESKARLLNRVEYLAKELQKANEQRDEIEMNCRTQHTGKIDNLTSKVNSLSTELGRVTEERDQAQDQNRIHNNSFDSLRLEIDSKVEEFERTHAADKDEISRLQRQVTTMEKQLEEGLYGLENLKANVSNREPVEEASENVPRENHHLLDPQINKLQEELTSLRLSESEKEHKLQLLVKAMESMEADTETILASKNAAVDGMEQALAEKQGLIDRLSIEKEQLVLSMNDMTASRRDEIDELQNELMEMSTRAANQAREIQTLKVQLEDGKHRKEEMDRLRKRVRELSEQVANQGVSTGSKPEEDRTVELEVENSKLRQRLRDASLSLKVAEEKIRDMGSANSSSKAMQVLRDRNVTLKFEVEKLTKKLKRLAERKHKKTDSSPADSGDPSVPSVRYSEPEEALDSVEATRFMI
jgi:chromosome segregation ATPase